MGIAKLPLIDLEPDTNKEFDVRLLPSLDTLKIKDKKDRGTLTVMVSDFYNPPVFFGSLHFSVENTNFKKAQRLHIYMLASNCVYYFLFFNK